MKEVGCHPRAPQSSCELESQQVEGKLGLAVSAEHAVLPLSLKIVKLDSASSCRAGADVHYSGGGAGLHLFQQQICEQEGCQHVDREGRFQPIRCHDLLRVVHASVVDQHVEPVEFLIEIL